MDEPLEAGSPDEEIIWTPGVVPASALVTFVATLFAMVSLFTMAADPVKDSLVAVP